MKILIRKGKKTGTNNEGSMIWIRFIYPLLMVILFAGCSKNTEYVNNKGLLAGLSAKRIDEGKYYQGFLFSVELKNTKRETLGAVFVGKFRRSLDTTAIARSTHDCILEVKQNGILRRSTDFEKLGPVFLDHAMPELYKFKKDSSANIILEYLGDLRKYFHLDNSSYSVRVLLIPEELNVKLYEKIYKEQYIKDFQNVKLIRDTLKTPFVRIN